MDEIQPLSTVEAQKKFATILSKAIYENEQVRGFIKTEALAQFDNDYDVFYPFIKDKVVSDGDTFREIMLSYCDNEDELLQVEKSLPLLNILVPDLSLFYDFNAEIWDITDEEVSIICREDDDNTIFENGEAIGCLPLDEIPGFPCLVVKNNERLKATTSTRSGESAYEFTNDAFDGSLRAPETRHSEYDQDLEETSDDYYLVFERNIDPLVINAYEEFKDNKYAYERDYIYYGITSSNQPGELDIRAYK